MTIDYGTDIHTPNAMDLDPAFSFVAGLQALGEALARRCVTARGSLEGDPSYGYDVRQHLNDDAPDVATIGAAVTEELGKDERVDAVTASVKFDSVAELLTITATGFASTVGPFRLVIAIDAVTVALLDMEMTS